MTELNTWGTSVSPSNKTAWLCSFRIGTLPGISRVSYLPLSLSVVAHYLVCVIVYTPEYVMPRAVVGNLPSAWVILTELDPTLVYKFYAVAEKPAPRKREVAQPRPGFLLEGVKMETITPIPYDIIKEGLQQ